MVSRVNLENSYNLTWFYVDRQKGSHIDFTVHVTVNAKNLS